MLAVEELHSLIIWDVDESQVIFEQDMFLPVTRHFTTDILLAQNFKDKVAYDKRDDLKHKQDEEHKEWSIINFFINTKGAWK